ncbi:hypothetical protein ACJJTC_017395 [Scirpophaga incertulas]
MLMLSFQENMHRVFLPLLLVALVRSQDTCLSSEEEPYLLFGTKTAYIFAHKGLSNNNRAHEVPGCKPIAFWLMNRHGSHNPESNEIKELQNLEKLKDNIILNYRNHNLRNSNHRMCPADVNLLERWLWNPRHNQTFAGDLTSDGYMSTQQLAQAWRQKYPGLLTDNRHDYLFRFSNYQRSSTTFRAFTEGLFKTQADGIDLPKENDEKHIRPYKFCNTWVNNVEQNNETLTQRETFESSLEYKQMVTNVSQRLGFNYDMEPQVVRNMYQMCAYNKAWDVTQISPWCAVFSHEDLKRLEYAEDLEAYYKYGYGSDLNEKVGCVYIKDMMAFFQKHIDNESIKRPRVSVLMAEAAGILLALRASNAYRPTSPLTAETYPGGNSRWSSSTMAPYNANFAAILYKCTLNGKFQINDKYQVLFLENEKPISFEGCRVGLCDWSRVNTLFANVVNSCDLKACNVATRGGPCVAIILMIVVLILKITRL